MYDIDWAQRVYVEFCKDCTRTINIDACIIQRVFESAYKHLSRLDVQICLIDSIASPRNQEPWVLYKRLIKKKVLDTALLDKVSNRILSLYLDRKDRTSQLLLF